MSVYIEIAVDDRQAEEFFTYAGYKVRDMRDPFEQVMYEVVLAGIVEQFTTQGDRTGGWEPLNDKYLGAKIAKGLDPRIMFATGALYEELVSEAMSMRGVKRDALEFISYNNKLDWNTFGGFNGKGTLPPRPVLTVTGDDELKIAAIFEFWLDELRMYNSRRNGPATRPDTLPSIINVWI